MALATVALYAVLALWAAVTPGFRAPDEPQHMSTVFRLAYDHTYPDPGDARIFPAVKASYPQLGFSGMWLNSVGTAPLADTTDHPRGTESMRELAKTAALPTEYDFDQITQHPPGYYALMAIPTRVLDLQGQTPRDALLALRLMSAALLLPLPYLVFRLAKEFGVRDGVAAISSFGPLAIPQLTHIGAAVNSDSLIIVLAALLTVQSVRIARRGATVRRGVWLGVTFAAALLTKGLALPLATLPIGAYLLAWRRDSWSTVVRPAVATAAVSLVGVLWWARNVVEFGVLQPTGYSREYLDLFPPKDVDLSFTTWMAGYFDLMARSFWFDFGWLELKPPPVLYGALSVASARVGGGRRGAGGSAAPDRPARAAELAHPAGDDLPAVAARLDGRRRPARVAGAVPVRWGRGVGGDGGRRAGSAHPTLRRGARSSTEPAPTEPASTEPAPGSRWAAAVPIVVIAAAFGGLAVGIGHFYSGDGFVARVGAMSSWSPVRLRAFGVIAVVAAGAVLAAAALQWRSGRRLGEQLVAVDADVDAGIDGILQHTQRIT